MLRESTVTGLDWLWLTGITEHPTTDAELTVLRGGDERLLRRL